MEIPGIPEAISWTVVRDFLDSLGIDPNQVARGGVVIGSNVLSCDVFALDAEGRRYVDLATEEVAKHRVSIRIDWPEDQPTRLRTA